MGRAGVAKRNQTDSTRSARKPLKVVPGRSHDRQNQENSGWIAAIHRVQAVVEFGMDGEILNANENFLKSVGYTLEEIKGKHHSIFVNAEYRQSAEYRGFWESLNRGEYQASEYKRLGKSGREVWFQASHNPIFDLKGKPFKVITFATDVTEPVKLRMRAAEQAEHEKRAAEELHAKVDSM